MDIKINKDIAKEYPDDAWKGFSVAQLGYLLAAAAAGAGTVCFLYFILGFNIHVAVYGAFPVAGPLALMGFYQHAGMRFTEMVGHFLRIRRMPVYPYAADECRVPDGEEEEEARGILQKWKQKREIGREPETKKKEETKQETKREQEKKRKEKRKNKAKQGQKREDQP